jgi:hypothetical protein
MDDNTKIVAPGVKRTDLSWGFYLEGTRDALITAGVANLEWFPTGREKNKRGQVSRTTYLKHDGRDVDVNDNKGDGRRCVVRVMYTPDEVVLKRQRAFYEEALAKERLELAFIPKTREEYRRNAARRMAGDLAQAIELDCTRDEYSGYRYAPEVIEELEGLAQEMVTLLQAGRTIFTPALQRARIAAIKSKTAAADPGLREFLDRVASDTQ